MDMRPAEEKIQQPLDAVLQLFLLQEAMGPLRILCALLYI